MGCMRSPSVPSFPFLFLPNNSVSQAGKGIQHPVSSQVRLPDPMEVGDPLSTMLETRSVSACGFPFHGVCWGEVFVETVLVGHS